MAVISTDCTPVPLTDFNKKSRHLDRNAVEWRDLSRDRFSFAEHLRGSRLRFTPLEMTVILGVYALTPYQKY
jgi:hypothetical protein